MARFLANQHILGEAVPSTVSLQNLVVSNFRDYRVIIGKVKFRDKNFRHFKSTIGETRLHAGLKIFVIEYFCE